jgi:beta-lactamase regulating signal transducer with metallopeptidase domain
VSAAAPASAAAFAGGLAVKATILLALAAAADRAARRRASAAARHLLWAQVVAALLVLPAAVALVPDSVALRLPRWAASTAPGAPSRPDARGATRPAVGVGGRATATPAPAVGRPGSAAPDADATLSGDTLGAAAPRPAAAAAAPARGAWPAWPTCLAVAYGAGVLVLLARIAAQHRVVARLARGAAPVRGRAWDALAADAARALGVRAPVTLLRGGESAMPMTWGVRRPAVLLPSAADAWPAARRRAVLLHEYAHVARRDCLTQLLAALACVLYWPHPGVWWAAARLREERELACDDLVLGRGLRGHDYAAHLLAIARLHRAPRTLAALPAAPATPSALERRLRAALDDERVRGAPSGPRARGGAALTALVLLTLAAVRGGAAPAQPPGRAAEAARVTQAARADAPRRGPAPPSESRGEASTFQGSGAPSYRVTRRRVDGACGHRRRGPGADVRRARGARRAADAGAHHVLRPARAVGGP